MSEAKQPQEVDFTVDRGNLYREESITDLKVASIRKLVPIKADGTDDESRETLFVGNTQLMSPQGPLPIQAPLEASNLNEAMDAFPAAMKEALAEVVERIRKLQQEQRMKESSRIITPGN